MPTYVYACERCGHRFELLQGISDPPRKRCPRCRGKVKRVITSGGGLIFKGSGFYVTDYKRKESAGRARQGKEAAGEKEAAADSKPAAEKPKDAEKGPAPGGD